MRPKVICQQGGAAFGGWHPRESGAGLGYWPKSTASLAPALASSFLCAGSSALLLLITHLFPAYWYFSFVALAPFLYKSSRSDESEGLRLGFFLGVSFLTVSAIDSIVIAPWTTCLRILLGTGLFSLFGWSVGWARRRFGSNPLIVALLWVVFEAGLLRLGFGNGLLAEAEFTLPFLHSIATLFGFLIVALIIVLINSLLIVALEVAVSVARARGHQTTEGKRNWDLILFPGLVAQRLLLVTDGRGPPRCRP